MTIIKKILVLAKWTSIIGIGLVAIWAAFCLLVIVIMSFATGEKNISNQKPYKAAIGRHFILQKDMYLYQFNDRGSSLRIGDINNMSNPSIGIPTTIEEKYIGVKGAYITLKGIAKKGTLFTITSIIKKQTLEDIYYIYNIKLNNDIINLKQKINSSDIINLLKNPPDSKTWSDPPIFKPQYALPLPSDGIWWK